MWKAITSLALTLTLAASSCFAAHFPAKSRTTTELFAYASDGTPLTWRVTAPAGSGPHPAVLVIHGGGFRYVEAGPTLHQCESDLAAAGFIAFTPDYRLAPPGRLPGQISDGHYPDQTDDVHLAVAAARNDPRSTGKVGAVGGSAGGSHAAYCAETGTPGVDQLDAAVCLSGAYQFDDTDSWAENATFEDDVKNYVGSDDPATLHAASPVAFVNAASPPLALVASTEEAMPSQQLPDLAAALSAIGVPFEQVLYPGHRHAFANWNVYKPQAIAFLQAHL